MRTFLPSAILLRSLCVSVIFPLAFVVSHIQSYFPFLDIAQASLFFLRYVLYALVCWLLLYFFTRKADKTGIILIVLLAINFFFASVHDGIKGVFGEQFFTRYRFILPAIVFVVIALLWGIRRSDRSYEKAIGFVLVVMCIFISIDIIRIVHKSTFPTTSGTVTLENTRNLFLPCDTCKNPDVYFLVYDELASSASLEKQFGFNNRSVDSFLINQGFQIAEQSRANYNWTQFSLASMLNMTYLCIPDTNQLVYEDYMAVTNLIKHAAVFDFFREKGYCILNYTGFDIKSANPPIDYEVAPDMIYTMNSNTFFNKLDRDIGWNYRKHSFDTSYMNYRIENAIRYHRQAKEGVLNAVGSPSSSPRFVYAHFFVSHRPFFMDSLGDRRTALEVMTDTSRKQIIDAYWSNIKFVGKEIESLVTSIKKGTNGNSIIIIIGDHGFRSFDISQDTISYFQNFNAVYLPGTRKEVLSDSISGVNQFRWLLNNRYGQKLPFLKDAVYFLVDKP